MAFRISTFLLPALALLASVPAASAQSFSFSFGGVEDDTPLSKDPYPATIRVSPSTLKPGRPYAFTVTASIPVRAARGNALTLKGPGGTEYTSQNSSYSFSNINGRTASSSVYRFTADAPASPGEYRFPAQTIALGAVKISIPETLVTVRALAPGESAYGPATIRLTAPAGEYFVGQEIHARLAFADGNDETIRQIGNLSLVGGDDFTVTTGALEKGVETVDGVERNANILNLTLRPNSTGDKAVAVKAAVAVSADEESPVTLRSLSSAPLAIRVAHAPTEGKPASYLGAIGRFTVSPVAVEASPRKAGEPFRISFSITGDGALDRIVPPVLAADNWVCKTETPRPVRNGSGLSREFTYTVTPLYGGEQNAPSGEFSWFDPVERAYKRVALGGGRVTIEGPAAAATSVVKTNDESPVLPADPAPTGKRVAYATLAGSAYFMVPQLVLTALLAVAALVTRRIRKVAADPALRARITARRELRRHRRAARIALAKKDFSGFGEHARAALRAGVSPSAHANAGALTAEETLAALPVDDAARRAIAPLFDAETAARFAGETEPTANPAHTEIFTTLGILEKSLR